MKLSTRARYAARALTEIALGYPGGTITAKDVAERQGISAKYLEQLLASLKAAGLVKAIRGARGGFALARPPEDITLKQVLEVLEGSVAPVECVDHPESCPMKDICPTRDTWVDVRNAVESVLGNTTLLDLVRRRRAKLSSAQMYHI